MNYTQLPSLKRIATIRVAIQLWGKEESRELMTDFYLSFTKGIKNECEEIEEKVGATLLNLCLPRLLKDEVLAIVRPVACQIARWIKQHAILIDVKYFIKKHFDLLHWTPWGTVDRKRTAEVLVKNESLNLILAHPYPLTRYVLACINCLEEAIHSPWPKLNHPHFHEDVLPQRCENPGLVSFWNHYRNGNMEELKRKIGVSNTFECGFYCAVVNGNRAGAEYFWKKLVMNQSQGILIKAIRDVESRGIFNEAYYADVVCFLLNNMDEEQQLKTFRHSLPFVLTCLLEWPWQDFFMKTAKQVLEFLPQDDPYLFNEISFKIKMNFRDYDYRRLFGVFWQHYPNVYKKKVFNNFYGDLPFLANLFDISDKENLKLIFMDFSVEEKAALVYGQKGWDPCGYLIQTRNSDLMQFFIEECICCKSIVVNIKNILYSNYITLSSRLGGIYMEGHKLFVQVLDNYLQKGDKRRQGEEGSGRCSPCNKKVKGEV